MGRAAIALCGMLAWALIIGGILWLAGNGLLTLMGWIF